MIPRTVVTGSPRHRKLIHSAETIVGWRQSPLNGPPYDTRTRRITHSKRPTHTQSHRNQHWFARFKAGISHECRESATVDVKVHDHAMFARSSRSERRWMTSVNINFLTVSECATERINPQKVQTCASPQLT